MSNPVNLAMLRSLGIKPEDYADDDAFEVWPENVEAVNFWLEYCCTQWNYGFNGPTGINYQAVKLCIDMEEPDAEKAKDLFWCVRKIERGALTEFADRRAREEQKG